ncbi:MAG TPA: sugar phosphate isomerase/epimerase, partial [Bacteroidales bacterium]|nr:sugar phosphate isomerase/epimerase [Bacteroidales bacterium]
MENTRRNFLKTLSIGSAVTLGAGSLGFSSHLENEKNDKQIKAVSQLKLSCQENVAPGNTLSEKLDFLEKLGFAGFEQGCGGILQRAGEIQKALQNRKIKISVVCAGFEGHLIADTQTTRDLAMKTIKEALTNAGELGALGVIVVPAFNSQPSLPFVDARKILVDELKELGEHAVKNKTKVILEPLNREEAWFLRQVADAASICRDVNSEGIGCMGDFWHMTWEETSDMGAFISGGKYLTHVHVASRERRKMPGEDSKDDYTNG